jgi:glycosyltransferase involved in cell wall biosynthesis
MARKILYVAENAISPYQGGGIVVAATLHGMNPADLLGFYRYTNITPSAEYAARFHELPSLGGAVTDVSQTLPPSPLSAFPATGLHHYIRGARQRIRSFAGPVLATLYGSDERTVRERAAREGFSPEVVFTAPLSHRMLSLAVRCAESYRIPLVMLNMDDWISEESARLGPLAGAWRSRIARTMARAKPHVIYAYSNSPHLAEILTRRYGIEHEAMNNASPELLAGRPSWQPPPKRDRCVFTFAGAMNWHLQGQTLYRVAEAISELSIQRPVELRVLTPWEFAPMANHISVPGAVIYGGFRSGRDLVDAYLDSDFLVATTTFLEHRIHLFRHSLATKLSDYLCVGRPVISVGHPDWALHDYVEKNGCGIVVRTPDRSEVKAQLARAASMSEEARSRIGRANRALWERSHDAAVMARRLRQILGLDGPETGTP